MGFETMSNPAEDLKEMKETGFDLLKQIEDSSVEELGEGANVVDEREANEVQAEVERKKVKAAELVAHLETTTDTNDAMATVEVLKNIARDFGIENV